MIKSARKVILSNTLRRKRFFVLQFISQISVWISPWVISTDGNLYLSSAKSLFTNSMYEFFHFIRTPGYPLLIKIVTLDNFLLPLFIVQAFLLALGIHMTANAFERIRPHNSKITLVISILTLLVLRGYITGVLKEVLLLFIISLCVDFNSRLYVMEGSKKVGPALGIYYLTICFLATITFPILGIAAIGSTSYSLLRKASLQKMQIFYTISINLFICGLFLFSWSSFQDSAIESGRNNFPNSATVSQFQFFDSPERDKRFEQRMQASAAVLGLAPERYGFDSYSIGSEIKNYALPTFNTNIYDSPLECGRYDSIVEPTKSFIRDLRESNRFCRNQLTLEVSNFFNQIMRFGYFLWAMGFLAGFVFSIIRFRSKEFLLCSSVFIIYGGYVILGAGASRYGAPCFLISGFLLNSLLQDFNSREKSLQNESRHTKRRNKD